MREYIVPPVCQGQIVSVAYKLEDGYVYRRVFDGSDGSVSYARSRALVSDEGDYWNGPPLNRRWRQITAAKEEVSRKGGRKR